MLSIVDTIRKENQMYIDIGKKEGKQEGQKQKGLEIVKNMLKEKFSIETIQRITGIDKKEIKKLM